jgi:hypothetical protein
MGIDVEKVICPNIIEKEGLMGIDVEREKLYVL